ncbi:MAG: tRNA pseudouridine(38-40) synthase TruA [Flavobacteriaceae bacterium]|nr:tRNA pseudouridine(38-40) synthase TruA [Flavobacteriaceae bacterium]|tara:strand:- start:37443 stop:38225 length:783 start_codon:yes stop_codon:yes gene_type:complete
MKYPFSYLLKIQFLGFRFSGWQKQVNAKTIHEMVDKSLSYVLVDQKYKTVGMSRTDAKVSAQSYFIHLFVHEEFEKEGFMKDLNFNFPHDIRLLEVSPIPTSFDLISTAKLKTYHYYFSKGEKVHPYASPFLFGVIDNLNIPIMQEGAQLFEGEHNFRSFCTKPSEHTRVVRTVDYCRIQSNTEFTASFFPKESYVLEVRGAGFLRYQIRLMMATLIELGKGNIDLDFIRDALENGKRNQPLPFIAPASGLHLRDIQLKP